MNTPRHNPLVRGMVLVVFAFLCAQTAFAHPQKGEAVGFLDRLSPPHLGTRSRASDGCGRAVGCALVLRRFGFCPSRFRW